MVSSTYSYILGGAVSKKGGALNNTPGGVVQRTDLGGVEAAAVRHRHGRQRVGARAAPQHVERVGRPVVVRARNAGERGAAGGAAIVGQLLANGEPDFG